ncbi:aldehyde dehydrogenase [Paenibacillus chungangensis]|uniref:Aldehyde dehydrogenase n=1 Tax=Paenibacillus chungangensis TaxID=696535 RepID=A0ABW3HTJ3_9BACL
MEIRNEGDVERLLAEHSAYFHSGATSSLAFRKEQLVKLRQAILAHEKELMQALYKDLRKSETEAYATEIGLVLHSISYTMKRLSRWMKPERVRTPLHQAGTKSWMMREPYGTVLIVGPFNYPVQLVLEPLVGAIAAGNCAIVKPSESTPHVSAVIRQLIEGAFEPKYIRVVEGGKETTSLLVNARFDYIFFTGSVAVGRIVMAAAARHLVPVTLELGGKSPVIVDRTANIELAAKRIIWGKLMNAGQTCIAPDYMLVHRDVKERLVVEMRRAVAAFYGNNPAASEDYGRIVNERQFDRLAGIVEADRQRIIWGGQVDRKDLYIEPVLLDAGEAVDRGAGVAAMEDELFGPALPLLTYSRLEEAIAMVLDRPKPLALYLFTEDEDVEHQVLGRISFGGGCVNDTISHVINTGLPFGGVGESGMGGYHGKHTFETFSHRKSLIKRSTHISYKFMFPPYKDKLKWLRKVLK